MPKIQGYTRQVQPRQMVQAQAGPQAFGYTQNNPAAEAVQELTGALEQAVIEKNSREDVIARTKAVAQYNEELEAEYLRTITEEDLSAPGANTAFNQKVRDKADEYLTKFSGSPTAKAQLEVDLQGYKSRFISQMNTDAFNAQQEFIAGVASKQVDSISAEAYQSALSGASPDVFIAEAFTRVDDIFGENNLGPALADEGSYRQAARGMVVENAVNSYLDAGRYEEADQILSNYEFVSELPAQKQKELMKQTNGFLNQKRAAMAAINSRKAEVEAIEASGITLSDESKAQYVLGSELIKQDLSQKINTLNINTADISTQQMLAITEPELYKAMQEAKGDPNKERRPDGNFTEKGVSANIGKDIAPLSSAQTNYIALKSSVEEFKRTGNRAAIVAAITGFKKAFDPTSAVMEGEIRLQQETQSWASTLETMLNKGQALGEAEIDGMLRTADGFIAELRKVTKPIIDEHLTESDRLGYTRYNVGLPKQKYQNYFGTYETGKQEKTIFDYTDEELLNMVGGQ